jgi:hypothetical protein
MFDVAHYKFEPLKHCSRSDWFGKGIVNHGPEQGTMLEGIHPKSNRIGIGVDATECVDPFEAFRSHRSTSYHHRAEVR